MTRQGQTLGVGLVNNCHHHLLFREVSPLLHHTPYRHHHLNGCLQLKPVNPSIQDLAEPGMLEDTHSP